MIEYRVKIKIPRNQITRESSITEIESTSLTKISTLTSDYTGGSINKEFGAELVSDMNYFHTSSNNAEYDLTFTTTNEYTESVQQLDMTFAIIPNVLVKNSLSTIQKRCDITKGGTYSYFDVPFSFSIENTSKLQELFNLYKINIKACNVELYMIDSVFDVENLLWSGLIKDVSYGDTIMKFNCNDNLSDKHSITGNKKFTKTEFPSMDDSLIGVTIPQIIGDVKRAKYFNVNDNPEPLTGIFDGPSINNGNYVYSSPILRISPDNRFILFARDSSNAWFDKTGMFIETISGSGIDQRRRIKSNTSKEYSISELVSGLEESYFNEFISFAQSSSQPWEVIELDIPLDDVVAIDADMYYTEANPFNQSGGYLPTNLIESIKYLDLVNKYATISKDVLTWAGGSTDGSDYTTSHLDDDAWFYDTDRLNKTNSLHIGTTGQTTTQNEVLVLKSDFKDHKTYTTWAANNSGIPLKDFSDESVLYNDFRLRRDITYFVIKDASDVYVYSSTKGSIPTPDALNIWTNITPSRLPIGYISNIINVNDLEMYTSMPNDSIYTDPAIVNAYVGSISSQPDKIIVNDYITPISISLNQDYSYLIKHKFDSDTSDRIDANIGSQNLVQSINNKTPRAANGGEVKVFKVNPTIGQSTSRDISDEDYECSMVFEVKLSDEDIIKLQDSDNFDILSKFRVESLSSDSSQTGDVKNGIYIKSMRYQTYIKDQSDRKHLGNPFFYTTSNILKVEAEGEVTGNVNIPWRSLLGPSHMEPEFNTEELGKYSFNNIPNDYFNDVSMLNEFRQTNELVQFDYGDSASLSEYTSNPNMEKMISSFIVKIDLHIVARPSAFTPIKTIPGFNVYVDEIALTRAKIEIDKSNITSNAQGLVTHPDNGSLWPLDTAAINPANALYEMDYSLNTADKPLYDTNSFVEVYNQEVELNYKIGKDLLSESQLEAEYNELCKNSMNVMYKNSSGLISVKKWMSDIGTVGTKLFDGTQVIEDSIKFNNRTYDNLPTEYAFEFEYDYVTGKYVKYLDITRTNETKFPDDNIRTVIKDTGIIQTNTIDRTLYPSYASLRDLGIFVGGTYYQIQGVGTISSIVADTTELNTSIWRINWTDVVLYDHGYSNLTLVESNPTWNSYCNGIIADDYSSIDYDTAKSYWELVHAIYLKTRKVTKAPSDYTKLKWISEENTIERYLESYLEWQTFEKRQPSFSIPMSWANYNNVDLMNWVTLKDIILTKGVEAVSFNDGSYDQLREITEENGWVTNLTYNPSNDTIDVKLILDKRRTDMVIIDEDTNPATEDVINEDQNTTDNKYEEN